MDDLPLVSIAAINYNNSKYILETLESIRNQTYPNIELIIVDDCSTDDCVAIIENWLSTYNGQYKFIRHEVNKGVCATCNSGLANATGKYFSLIATDDLVLPEKITGQVQILEASDTAVAGIYSDAYLIDDNSMPLPGVFIDNHRSFVTRPGGNIYEVLLQGNYIPAMTVLIKKQVFDDIGGFDENLAYDDYDMWLRIARKYQMLFSDFISCKYRIRPGSLSSTIKNWNLSDVKIFLKHVGAPLPMQRLRKIALDVYTTDDKDTIPFLKELADKTLDRYLLTTCLLWKTGIPKDSGTMILNKLNEDIVAVAPPDTNEPDAVDFRIFIKEVMPLLPVDLLYSMGRRFYLENDPGNLSLLSQLAGHKQSRYLLAAYLLAHYRVPVDIGDEILQSINEVPGTDDNCVVNNVSGAEADLFLNNIYPILHIGTLKKMAYYAYAHDSAGLIALVQQMAYNNAGRYLLATYLLAHYRVPVDIGDGILQGISEVSGTEYHYAINNIQEQEAVLFMNNIYPILPIEMLKKIALYTYAHQSGELILLLKQITSNNANRYILTAYLLTHYRITVNIGDEILQKVKEAYGSDWNYPINNLQYSDANLFMNNTYPALQTDMQRKIARFAFENNNNELIFLVKEMVNKNADKYLLAAYLLAQYRLPIDIGDTVLRIVNGGPCEDAHYDINKITDTDLFIKNIYPVLPPEVLKTISFYAYAHQNNGLILVVKEMRKIKEDRCFKATWLLWKFKIRIPVGAIILARINEYCKIGKSNLYIDLCIYKDVIEALIRYNSVQE